jgi:hypothetical protein
MREFPVGLLNLRRGDAAPSRPGLPKFRGILYSLCR